MVEYESLRLARSAIQVSVQLISIVSSSYLYSSQGRLLDLLQNTLISTLLYTSFSMNVEQTGIVAQSHRMPNQVGTSSVSDTVAQYIVAAVMLAHVVMSAKEVL